jgi:hypothetical protein
MPNDHRPDAAPDVGAHGGHPWSEQWEPKANGAADHDAPKKPQWFSSFWANLDEVQRWNFDEAWTEAGADLNYEQATDACILICRNKGLTLDQTVRVAEFFPHTFGKLANYRALIDRLWAEQLREEAKAKAEADAKAAAELRPTPWVYRDPTTIPPREWLVGTILIRDYATLLGSTGGVGKTAFAVALALTFITGRRDILGLHVFETGRVWLLTLEDDRLELERRIAAAMLKHEIKPEDVVGKLFVNAASERPVLLARPDEDGVFVTCEDAAYLQAGIQSNGVGLTIIDPLVKSHALTENSNEHMDKLIALANQTAEVSRITLFDEAASTAIDGLPASASRLL